MADVRDILVGAAQLFISKGSGANRPDTTASVLTNSNAQDSVRKYLLGSGSAAWRDAGYTNNGLEVSYEPGYNDVMVDQLLDAARLFKSTIKVILKTELTEATLQNINVVFGQQDQYNTFDVTGAVSTASTVTSSNLGTSSAVSTLAIQGGSIGDAPVERSIVAVGVAPTNFTSNSASTASLTAQSQLRKERVYVARKVVQVESTSHGLKRDTATVFPVQFRCLPDDADKYDGSEYGLIIDRVYGA